VWGTITQKSNVNATTMMMQTKTGIPEPHSAFEPAHLPPETPANSKPQEPTSKVPNC
jgi:hypothetical protein